MRLAVTLVLLAGASIAGPTLKWGNPALTFEPNRGQAPADVRYVARSASFDLYFKPGETLLIGRGQTPFRMKFLDANPAAPIAGESLQPATTNYFVGNDPRKWHASVPNYERLRYTGVYPGIDLVYYGKDGHLEYDWIASPGADPSKIRMSFEQADRLRVDRDGDLIVTSKGHEFKHKRPVVYQKIHQQRVTVRGAWNLKGKQASFRIGDYDPASELIIDPPLLYSTYYGGNGGDFGFAVAVDSIGNTYVAGSVGSANLNVAGVEDAFVMKLSLSGSKMYTTFIGGHAADEAHGIAVDVQGNAYVTGSTGSLDFPLQNALQTKPGGSGDAFVTKLSPSGAIVYSTYLGGNGIDTGSAIAVDTSRNVYVIGSTFSTNFPTQSAYQSSKGAQEDTFVAKINPAGSALVYSTYLGGDGVDEGNGIAVDAAGNAYLTGYTGSNNFPMQSAFRSSNLATVDAFVAKLNPAGSALVYSTYLGGSGTDYGTAIAVDSSGSAYVTGVTASEDFPINSPIDIKLGSHAVDDAFVTKFTPSGGLSYSTYLGGGSEDQAFAIAIDSVGNAYVTGRTNSSDFPLTNPIQTSRFAFDMFITEIDATASTKLFSTFIGGTGSESGRGIAVDPSGNIHVAGEGTSSDFPVKNAMQGTSGGGAAPQDALILAFGTGSSVVTGPVITKISDNLIDGGPVTPGGWFYVKGTDLADVQRIWRGDDFSDPNTLPTDLDGTEVWVNGAPVPVYFISSGQVNAQAPSNISGSITVQVFRLGIGSNILTAPVADVQPSIYNYQVGGKSYAAALFSDYSLMGDPAVTPGTHKAKPGDNVQLYTAGLGAAASGSTISSPVPVTGVGVQIGSLDAQVTFAGLVAPGQYQVNIVVPQITDGEYNITVSRNGKTSPPNILFEIGQ